MTPSFMPHGMCFSWQPGVLLLHILSDALITLAYFVIAATLAWLVSKRGDLPFKGIFWMFALFIVSCGATHGLAIWVIWHPDYWLEGAVKAVTAVSSIATMGLLLPLLPKALALRSPHELELINAELGKALIALRDIIHGYEHEEHLSRSLQDASLSTVAQRLDDIMSELRSGSRGAVGSGTENLFTLVVEASPSAMVLVDEGGRITLVNAQTEKLFGYTRNELLGQSIELLVPKRFVRGHPGLRDSFNVAPLAREMGAGRDLHGRRKDANEVPVEIGLNPIKTLGETFTLAVIVDISDRKQKELRIESALKEKDILLAEIHHRVKNNLQIVYSLLDLQSERVEDKVALDMLRDSQNRIKSMALIHQTLYQSKDFARVDFSNFVDSLVPNLVQSYGLKSDRVVWKIDVIKVHLPVDHAIPCGLIVSELISNALKHAFPEGRHGEIKVGLTSDVAGWVVLTVTDDGVGIPEDFDLAQATTLGLQLVNLLADQLHGEITIQRSKPTRFVLRFPVRLLAEAKPDIVLMDIQI